jgi:hypothetical protein
VRRGEGNATEWRRSFEEIVARTSALMISVPPSDRRRDQRLRESVLAAVTSKVRYVCALSAAVDVSFTPRHFAASVGKVEPLRSRLEGQLILELLRTGSVGALFKDQDANIVCVSQLEDVVQFWAIMKVEPIGNELRISERTGYQWWIPFGARTQTFGLPMRSRLLRVQSAIGDGADLGWPFSGFVTKPLGIVVCSVLAFLFFPLGLALWGAHATIRAVRLKAFLAWNDPAAGDSLDVALLANERGARAGAYPGWRIDTILDERGRTAYPDVTGRIDGMRELVGAAVTQAVEEALNAPEVAASRVLT